MAAYSFDEWRLIDKDRRKATPGIAITQATGLLPPSEGGLYWSGQTKAQALFGHAERMLSSEDPAEALYYWGRLRNAAVQATEVPIARERALQNYRSRVENALQAEPDIGYDGNVAITDAQLAHFNWLEVRRKEGIVGGAALDLNRIIEDVSRLAPKAEPARAAEQSELAVAEAALVDALARVADFAPAATAVGFDASRNVVERTEDEIQRLNAERRRRILAGAVSSFTPEPEEVNERAESFAVRAGSREEARAAEMLLRWAATTDKQPTPAEVRRWFAAAREDGLSAEPYAPEQVKVTAIVVADGGFDGPTLGHVLTDDAILRGANDLLVAGPASLRETLDQSGYAVITGAIDTEAGRRIVATGEAPTGTGERGRIVFLPIENDAPTPERSLAAQAVVARSESVVVIATDASYGRLPERETEEQIVARAIERRRDEEELMSMPESDRAGYRAAAAKKARGREVQEASRKLAKQNLPTVGWSPLAAQVTHLANRNRSLSAAIVEGTNVITGRELRALAAHARDVDAQYDPDRYWGASVFKPHGGLRSVLVDGSRVYKNQDELRLRLAAIPDHVVVMSTNHKASERGYDHNVTAAISAAYPERTILYAEVLRSGRALISQEEGKATSFQRQTFARELDVKLYDGPRGDPARVEVPWGTQPGEPSAPLLFSQKAPIILFSADADPIVDPMANDKTPLWKASDGRVMRGGEVSRLTQEAAVERAGAVMLFDDMGSDWNAANYTALAYRMGKPGLVIDADGQELSIAEAHRATAHNAYKVGFWNDQKIDSVKDTVMSNDLGSLILMRLPGDNSALIARYSAMAFAGETGPTLGQLLDGFAPDDWTMLSKSAQAALTSSEDLARIVDRAIHDNLALDKSGGMLFKSVDEDHPYRLADGTAMPMTVASTFADGRARPEGRVIALIAESTSAIEANTRQTVRFERDDLKLDAVEKIIETAAAKGDAVAINLAHGMPKAILEVALRHEAPIVLVMDGAPKAYQGELAALADRVMKREDSTLVMPAHLGPIVHPPSVKDLADAQARAIEEKQQLMAEWAADGRDQDLAKLDGALAEIDFKHAPKVEFREQRDRAFQLEALAAVADAAVLVAAGPRSQDLGTAAAIVAQGKPLAVAALDAEDYASRLAFAPTEFARGAGRIMIQDVERTGGGIVSGGAWSNIQNQTTEYKRVGGMWQGNAGQFESMTSEDPADFTTMVAGTHKDYVLRFEGRAPVVGDAASYDRFAASIDAKEPTVLPQDRGVSVELKPGWVQRDEELAAMRTRLAGFVREVAWEEGDDGKYVKVERVSPEIEEIAGMYERTSEAQKDMMRDAMGRGRPDLDEADARSTWDQGRKVVAPAADDYDVAVGLSR